MMLKRLCPCITHVCTFRFVCEMFSQRYRWLQIAVASHFPAVECANMELMACRDLTQQQQQAVRFKNKFPHHSPIHHVLKQVLRRVTADGRETNARTWLIALQMISLPRKRYPGPLSNATKASLKQQCVISPLCPIFILVSSHLCTCARTSSVWKCPDGSFVLTTHTTVLSCGTARLTSSCFTSTKQ